MTPSFWDWSLGVWSRPAIESFCLQLQDEQGVFVPALLFAGWCARFGFAFSDEALASMQLAVWDQSVITPVRRARRQARELGGAGELAHAQLRSCELTLEKQLMEQLASIAQAPACDAVDESPKLCEQRIRDNLQRMDISLSAADQAKYLYLLLESDAE